MNNLLKCIGFKGYNFCEEPLQPKENFYENDIKRKFYQCKKCRISRQKYIAAYIKTRLSLWKNDARVGLKKILYGEAIEKTYLPALLYAQSIRFLGCIMLLQRAKDVKFQQMTHQNYNW